MFLTVTFYLQSIFYICLAHRKNETQDHVGTQDPIKNQEDEDPGLYEDAESVLSLLLNTVFG